MMMLVFGSEEGLACVRLLAVGRVCLFAAGKTAESKELTTAVFQRPRARMTKQKAEERTRSSEKSVWLRGWFCLGVVSRARRAKIVGLCCRLKAAAANGGSSCV